MNLCKCSCGQEVTKERNKYINGHYNKNKKFSDDHKRKIGEGSKGKKRKPLSDEHKRKISEKSC